MAPAEKPGLLLYLDNLSALSWTPNQFWSKALERTFAGRQRRASIVAIDTITSTTFWLAYQHTVWDTAPCDL